MNIVGGVALGLLGLIFLGGAIRAMPIGRQRGVYLGPSTVVQVGVALLVSVALLAGSCALLR